MIELSFPDLDINKQKAQKKASILKQTHRDSTLSELIKFYIKKKKL